MNLPLILKRLLALFACAGVLTFASARLLAAEPAHEAAAHVEAAADAYADTAPAHHGHAEAKEPTLLEQALYSYLTAYMFCLSIVVGAMFLILLHYLFDAAWSVPLRRINEQIACLMPIMGVLALPMLVFGPSIYPWMSIDPATDHALDVKKILFNRPTFIGVIIGCFMLWSFMALRFRKWSVAQDKDGAAIWTKKARVQAAWGIYAFAFSLTLAVFLLMKSLQHQFFSTMYGVYYFAGSMWVTLATVYGIMRLLATLYVIVTVLKKTGPLAAVVKSRQMHDIGVLWFAFTVFYAYIHFSQYFLIWNAAIPEETFWYVKREAGSWYWVGMTILFGHFFAPFLILLRIDTKMNLLVMGPMIAWAWAMHYLDMTFNVMPVLYPNNLHLTLLDPICWFGMAGFLAFLFWKNFKSAAPFPLKDPRLKEAITHHEVPAPGASAAHH